MILLDSSFLCAWYNDRDVHHVEARQVMTRLLQGDWGQGLLLEYVFVEVVTVLLARRGRDAAFDAAQRLLEARELDFLPCSEVFTGALDAFLAQPSRTLSFVDAALVAVARKLRTVPIATFDRGFQGLEGVTIVPNGSEIHEGS